MKLDRKALYLIRFPDSRVGAFSLALGLQIVDGALHFYDLDRGHAIKGHALRETETGLVWEQERDDGLQPLVLHVKYCDLDTYEREVRPHIGPGVPRFGSTVELHEWYRRQFWPELGHTIFPEEIEKEKVQRAD